MDVLYPCCCELHVHKKTVVACVIMPSGDETSTKTIRPGIFTPGSCAACAAPLYT
jgi:hypothetical protein